MPMLYVSLRQLAVPDPARVTRCGDITLVTFDPRITRLEATQWSLDHLTADEMRQFKEAYGVHTAHMPDWTTDDKRLCLYVPQAVRLAGMPALQGGPELDRRRAAGRLRWEEAACIAEMYGRTVDSVLASV